MDGNVSLFWSYLTYIPFCTDPKLWVLQPFFFGAWYWERWKQQGWSVRLVRVWSCSEFSDYQRLLTIQRILTILWLLGRRVTSCRFPSLLPCHSKTGTSDLVLPEQEAQSWASGHSQALPAGQWFARQVTGMRQGWSQATVPGQSDWVPDLQGWGQECVQLQQGSQQPGPRPDNLGQSWLEHRQTWRKNCSEHLLRALIHHPAAFSFRCSPVFTFPSYHPA